MLDKCVKSQKKFLYIVLFCKVKQSKMVSINPILPKLWKDVTQRRVFKTLPDSLLYHSVKSSIRIQNLGPKQIF